MVGGIGDMVKPAGAAATLFGTGKIVAFVVNGKPTTAKAAIIELDLFCHPARPQQLIFWIFLPKANASRGLLRANLMPMSLSRN